MVRLGQPAPTGVYVYCVAPAQPLAGADPPVHVTGIGGQHVRAVQHDGLAAVVSDAATARYDISRENLLAHERVVEGVLARTDVLPMRFGTMAASDEDVREELLIWLRDALVEQLERVRGCVELGLKALWERDYLFASIVSQSARIRALRDEIAAKPQAATYFDRITLGQLTEAAIRDRSQREAGALLDAVQTLAREVRVNDPIGDMMLLNAAFLVARGGKQAFDARVAELEHAYAGRVTLKYAGPLPPYNFVDLALHAED